LFGPEPEIGRGDERTWRLAKRVKDAPAAVVVPAVSESDLSVLSTAYKSGLILGWKVDGERGYRLTLTNRHDDYVVPANLTTYVEKLRKGAS
jgi:hypothetical protein